MIRDTIRRLSLLFRRSQIIREHCAAIEAYDAARLRRDTRAQRYAFDRLRAATTARLAAGL